MVAAGPAAGPAAHRAATRRRTAGAGQKSKETHRRLKGAGEPARCGPQSSTVTSPFVPSTRTVAPLRILRVAPVTDTTQGMPSSLDTMTAWLIWAPTSTTTPAAGTNSGVHEGSVIGA